MFCPRRLVTFLPFLAALLLCVSASSLLAQSQWQRCDTCYDYYKHDTTFRIGVMGIPPYSAGVDRLKTMGFDFLLGYTGPSPVLVDTSTALQSTTEWVRLFRRAYQTGIGIGYPPDTTAMIIDGSRVMENYWGREFDWLNYLTADTVSTLGLQYGVVA